MGLFKKVFKPVRKVAKKIIPKEVRPFLPYIAAAFGPTTAGLTGTAFGKAAAQKALMAAATSAATDEQGDPLRAGLLAITPDLIGAGATKLGSGDGRIAEFLNKTKTLKDGTETMSLVERAKALQEPETFGDFAKVIGGQTAIDQSAKFAEIQQDQIDAYNRQLQEQGVMNKAKRRSSIFNIYMNAGYDADYVNSVLDKYGYADGGEVEEEMSEVSLSPGKGKMTEIEKTLYAKEEGGDKSEGIMKARRAKRKKDDDEGDLASGLQAAAAGIEKAFGRGFGNVEPVPMLRFAKGGEVEEEVSESGIMTVASAPNNFAELNMLAIDLFGRPYDQLSDGEQETLMDFIGSKSQAGGEGIMQMASGYKSDIEEMYEQYVFEMEEMGLQPMSFAEFLAQARAGMAKGGMMKGPDWFTNRVEELMYQGLSYEEASEQAYNEGPGGGYKDGGKAQRRKKDEPADEIIETEQEIFIDKMPRPKRQGIMEAADGGIMEKDMRGGGFIPEGSKERADDVPARLSKNEFVMTADAVRAAGGGSVNKGAKRMYDLMYTLEGKI